MALEHALLVSLSERPAPGIELTRRFDRSIGFFWSATHQQIYRVLRADGGRRLGDRRAPAQTRRTGQARATPSPPPGAQVLADWIGAPTPSEPLPQRDRGEDARGVVRRPGGRCSPTSRELVADHRTRLAHYEQLERARLPRPRPRSTGHDLDTYLVLRGGILQEQFWIDWLTEYLEAHEETR